MEFILRFLDQGQYNPIILMSDIGAISDISFPLFVAAKNTLKVSRSQSIEKHF